MLSATAIAQARPKACQYKLWDERGLYLLIMPNGGRYWRFNYRFAGKRKTISLGVFPDVGLAVARDKREEARRRPMRRSRRGTALPLARSLPTSPARCGFGRDVFMRAFRIWSGRGYNHPVTRWRLPSGDTPF